MNLQASEHSTGEYIPCVMSVTNTRAHVVLIKVRQRQKIIDLTEECEDDFGIQKALNAYLKIVSQW